MLVWTLLLCFGLGALGQLEEEAQFGDDGDSDLGDFDLDIVRDFTGRGGAHVGALLSRLPTSECFYYCVHRLHAGSRDR